MMETVLIGNLTPKNLRRHLGESITDRIMEVGKVIEMNGTSYRQQLIKPPKATNAMSADPPCSALLRELAS